jgi:hypothetical protein
MMMAAGRGGGIAFAMVNPLLNGLLYHVSGQSGYAADTGAPTPWLVSPTQA